MLPQKHLQQESARVGVAARSAPRGEQAVDGAASSRQRTSSADGLLMALSSDQPRDQQRCRSLAEWERTHRQHTDPIAEGFEVMCSGVQSGPPSAATDQADVTNSLRATEKAHTLDPQPFQRLDIAPDMCDILHTVAADALRSHVEIAEELAQRFTPRSSALLQMSSSSDSQQEIPRGS